MYFEYLFKSFEDTQQDSLIKKCVETAKCPSFKNALENGHPLLTKSGSTLADGLAVSTVCVNAYATAAEYIDKCVLVR